MNYGGKDWGLKPSPPAFLTNRITKFCKVAKIADEYVAISEVLNSFQNFQEIDLPNKTLDGCTFMLDLYSRPAPLLQSIFTAEGSANISFYISF